MMCQTRTFFSFSFHLFSPLLLCSSPNFPTPSLLSLSIYLLSVSHSFSSSLCEFETNLDKHITTNQNQSVSFWKLWANLPSGFSGAAAQTRPDGYVTEAWHRSAIDISQVFFTACSVGCFVFMLLSLATHQGHDVRKQAGLDGDSLHAGLFLAVQMSWNLSSKVINVVSDCVIVLISQIECL